MSGCNPDADLETLRAMSRLVRVGLETAQAEERAAELAANLASLKRIQAQRKVWDIEAQIDALKKDQQGQP